MTIATQVRPRARVSPILAWAAVGLLFLLLQLYVYSAWILSDNFRATPVGPDPIPGHARTAMWVYEILSLITLAMVIPWFVLGIRKTGRIDSTRLMMLGWLSAYWLDPFLSFLRPMFTYNAYAFNRGCWCEFIPFWQTPNGARIAEPLLIDGPAYFFSFASTAVVALWCMKWVKNRWPRVGVWGLGLSGFVGVWITMGLLDIGMTRIFYFDAWGGAFQSASFWGGEFYQFPIYEFVLFPSTFVACAFLLYYADASGQTAIERGVETVSEKPWLRTSARILAFIAFCNVLNLTYTGAMGVHALYVDDWPATMPSWLANEQCGPSTGATCPPGIQ